MSYLLYRDAAAVTPDDTATLTADALFVGSAGDIQVDMKNGQAAVLLTGVPVGVLPIQVSRVYSSNLTAGDIVALRL